MSQGKVLRFTIHESRVTNVRHTRLRRALPRPHAHPPLQPSRGHRRLGPQRDDAAQGQRGARRGRGGAARADPSHAHRPAPRRMAARGRAASRSTTIERAPTCARCGATGATPTRCPSRWSRRRRWPARAASTRGAASAPANDWHGFLENFREVVRLAREEARLLADDTGLSRYDALMDRYEPGMRAADIDRIFGDVQAVAAGPDRARAGEAARRDGDRAGRAVSGRRAARAESRGDEAAAVSTSRPGGSTRARTRSAAACPRTCASPRATARTISCKA